MLLQSPRHRFNAVLVEIRAATPPAGGFELELYTAMTNKAAPRTDTTYAYDLFADDDHRPVLDAFLLSGATLDVITAVLFIPIPVLQIYEYLFFDRTSFRNRLEKISYASTYVGSAFAKELLKTGIMVGVDYLIWTYGGKEDVDTRLVVRHTMVDAYYRGMAHKGNSLTSGVSKESQKWWGTAIKNAEILEKMDPRTTKQAIEELRIALETTDETTPVEQSPVSLEDILH